MSLDRMREVRGRDGSERRRLPDGGMRGRTMGISLEKWLRRYRLHCHSVSWMSQGVILRRNGGEQAGLTLVRG